MTLSKGKNDNDFEYSYPFIYSSFAHISINFQATSCNNCKAKVKNVLEYAHTLIN